MTGPRISGVSKPGLPAGTSDGVKAVIWDWNGTLLDDLDICVRCLGAVLQSRGMPALGREDYRSRFGWPIRDFYRGLGFHSDADFASAAGHYVELFAQAVTTARLHPHATETLRAVAALGLRQVLISATHRDQLAGQLAPHSLGGQFEQVLGVTEALDPSKEGLVRAWLAGSGLHPSEVVMIGDTNHDEQIAEQCGTGFVRWGRGAQAPRPGTPRVVEDLREIPRLLSP